jgi:hypothetical protein
MVLLAPINPVFHLLIVSVNRLVAHFRWLIPVVCAIIGITNECKLMQVKTQQLYYVVENQVNDSMFRPIHLFSIGPSSGQTLVTKEEYLQCI